MSIKRFFKYTCDIIEETSIKSWWSYKKTHNTIYSWIPCLYYSSDTNTKDTRWSRLNTVWDVNVIIDIKNNLVRSKMRVIVYDKIVWQVHEWFVWNIRPVYIKTNENYIWLTVSNSLISR